VRAATANDRALQDARKLYAESSKLQRAFKFDERFRWLNARWDS